MHLLLSIFTPPHASNFTGEYDWLFWSLTAFCRAVTLLVFALMAVFAFATGAARAPP